MRAMIIGLEPEYNYPGDIKKWSANNTKYASNHGASLISRSLAKQFSADFVDDFSDIDKLNQSYDLCILALATHVTIWRDVSYYTEIVAKLKMKIAAFSMGVQDYSKSISGPFVLHSSMKQLLEYVKKSSGWIGVRGPHTAAILMQNGFVNVLPVGCPTFYFRLKNDLLITKPDQFGNPLIVYHRTLAEDNWHLCESATILGQDFLDEAVFTDHLPNDPIKPSEEDEYDKYDDAKGKLAFIKEKGVFFNTFQEWFNFIGRHDFVVGPRLHGCIAALIQGIPAVMLYRDLRVKEMADFYKVPALSYAQASKMSLQDIFNWADYSQFNQTHHQRFKNYTAFLNLIGLDHQLEKSDEPYLITLEDHIANNHLIQKQLGQLALGFEALNKFTESKENKLLQNLYSVYASKNLFVRIPRVIIRKARKFLRS